jgi:hypothetical protein
MVDLGPAAFAAICGGLIALVSYIFADLVMPRRKCPDCKTPFRKLRFLRTWREAWKGVMICKKCGCEIDPAGGKIRSGSTMSD